MVVVVGGGASGLLASILISRGGKEVLLLEKNSRVGKKILVSGNGKCNIGNISPKPKNYYSSNPNFIDKALENYGAKEIIDIFKTIGIEIIEGSNGKLFPLSLQASSVVDILEYEAKRLGVEIICDCEVSDISKKDNIFTIKSTIKDILAETVILTSGSQAYPKLGGSSRGLDIATSLGHNIVTPLPSLVQLSSDETWVKEVSGVKINSTVSLYANNQYITQKSGDVLFTKYGVSGLAILDISRDISIELSNHSYCHIEVDLMPKFSKERLAKLLLSTIDKDREIEIWLMGFINKKLAKVILRESKCRAKYTSELNRKEISKIVYNIKNLHIPISDTRGFNGAEVAIGGVDTVDINPKTMESKIVKDLYFTGEILDVDGDRGGYNFYFAWLGAIKLLNKF